MTETSGNLALKKETSSKYTLPAIRTRFSSAGSARCIVVLRQERRFNSINLHLYHYAGNNPVRYTDPDGRFIFNDISNNSGNEVNYQNNRPNTSILGAGESVVSIDNQSVLFPMEKIILPNNLNTLLYQSYNYSNDNNPNTTSIISCHARKLESGNYEISIKVENSNLLPDGNITMSAEGVVAYAGSLEVGVMFNTDKSKELPDRNKVIKLVNHLINKINNTNEENTKYNLRYIDE